MFHTLSKVKNNTASGENEPDKRIAHEQWLAKTADHIVVPTGREKQNLIRYYGARSAHIGTIPCGVNLDLFKPQDSHRVRESLGVPADAPMLLYVGRFAPLKGLDQLVLAAAQLQQCHENLHMVLVGGDGPLAPATIELQRLAESRGITRRIHFPGRVDQDQLPLFYNAADLVVLPSHYESFGLVVLEALACGTPVAATDVGGVDAVVREGVNGTVVAAPDADSIGSAVDRMLQRIKAHRPDKHAVRESIAAFDWRHIARLTVETYTRIMASHKMPGVSRSHACQTGIVP